MYQKSIADMTAEEILAWHEQERQEKERRETLQRELARHMADREAKLKASREAERIANLPPPDPVDLTAKQVTRLLGDRLGAVMDEFIGSGDSANLVLRRLVNARKEARIAKRQAELNAGAL